MIQQVEARITIIEASDLVAKDRNVFGKKTSSDPFAEIYAGNRRVGTTTTQKKTLHPSWHEVFRATFEGTHLKKEPLTLTVKLFDHDKLSSPDPMGSVTIDLKSLIQSHQLDTTAWYDIPPESAKNATGKIQIRLQLTVHTARALLSGNALPLPSSIRVGLAWDMLPGNTHVDLDVSCVALTKQGQYAPHDTVYYGNLHNSNKSIQHSGDEREGDAHGDDETMTMDLSRIPSNIAAMYILLSVATPGRRLADIRSTKLSIYEHSPHTHKKDNTEQTLCTFTPAHEAYSHNATTLFLARLAREDDNDHHQWVLKPMQDTHPTARDFGSLLPHLKSYSRDLMPHIHVDPTERVAILHKGGCIRVSDYCPHHQLPSQVTLGLAWEITNGQNVDLDASAVCLDQGLNLVDTVWFRQLTSQDGSIRHHGDEREGDALGDDEKITITLDQVSEFVQYIGIVINSYSRHELDDVCEASCHLFDPASNSDIASYAMTNSRELDKHTALVVACLYRSPDPDVWNLLIISQPAQGTMAKDNVPDLQRFLRENPPKPEIIVEDEEIAVEAEMPAFVPLVDEEIDLSGMA